MSDDDDDELALFAPYLKDRLTELSLDYETYGSYILPLMTEESQDVEEWDSVFELLQASSESHGDDEESFVQLRHEIERSWKDHREALEQQRLDEHQHREQEIKELIQHERELAEQEANKEAVPHATDKQVDASKKALMERFGYDIPDALSDEEDGPVSNRDVSKQLEADKKSALREHKIPTKLSEQQKTKQHRQSKQQLKEGRRKKTTKSERKR